ncbi:MAG TPA: hypothetical protein VL219_02905 [Steroidobacteraceae bacterium]|jgi:hypothetical protein|nr:hypothetical protein [Steroidobacteraceae bacterium]
MTRSLPAFLLLGAALMAGSAALADDPAGLKRYELPNQDTLEMPLPAGWKDEVEQPDGGGPPTIVMSIRPDGPRQVFITPEWPDPTGKDVRELAQLRDAIRDAAERVKPEAVESYLEVRQLNGANGVGYYFAATDRDPGPGEFKFMNQGALQVGTLTLWFTILANDGEDTVAVEALAMLQAATHRRTGLDQL